VLSSLGLTEESVEGVIGGTDSIRFRHGTIGRNAVLEAVKLPALVSGLDTSLSKVD
jgi:hypothetical protein